MLIRKMVSEPDCEIEVLLKSADSVKAAGKFLLGRLLLDGGRMALVFDDAARFHKDIAVTHRLRPMGGGWCEIDHDARTVRVSSASQAFGREPDRERTLRCFRQCLPGYDCEVAE
jgi:hypothetical protein